MSATNGNKVVVAVDGSSISDRAFDWYATHMHKPDQEVVILHVAVPPSLHGYAAMGAACSMPVDEVSRTIHEHVRIIKKLEDHFDGKLKEFDIEGKVIAVGHHNPSDAIVQYAEDNGISMVVLGSRGHSTIRQTLMGSVSSYVLHHCTMPVVVIPPHARF